MFYKCLIKCYFFYYFIKILDNRNVFEKFFIKWIVVFLYIWLLVGLWGLKLGVNDYGYESILRFILRYVLGYIF